ncbi:MAG: hypothetical protein ABIT08_16275 [Bacteroidia bacterium]
MKLDNTIILPGDNPDLSKQLLTSLIQKEDVVSIIIFGRDLKAEDAVQKADVRASASPGGIARKVAWMQDLGMLGFLKTLIKADFGGSPGDIDLSEHIGISISMTDGLRSLILMHPAPNVLTMESAFNKASIIEV